MTKFMYVFRGGAFVTKGLSATELGVHLGKWRAWVTELTKAGHSEPGGHPIQAEARTIRGSGRQVTDGPYAEGKDLVTGTLIVLADSLDEAANLAQGCPIYEFDGSVEVRPVLPREA
jgi:hypothetical protein